VTFSGGAGTATLTGTPAAGTGKAYVISISASSSSGTTQQTFTLTVRQAPAFTSSSSMTVTRGQALTFTVAATGYPLPNVSRTAGGGLPTGLTYTNNSGTGTATISGTVPTTVAAGAYTQGIQAKNAVSTATENLTITVK
jgi:hypothetical protein